ncbi:MAG: hypothetical protein M3209_11535 [Acidobacteriota bacterium]|nr:hypothetical protein [Acidobacteriota bacterium]
MKRYLFFGLLLFAVPAANAQTKTLLQRVQEVTNNHSSTNKITVYYSPQHEKKALELRAGLEEAKAYFDRKLKVKMPFTLAVLDDPQWNRIMSTMQRRDAYTLEADKPSGLQPYSQPYGIPMSSAPPYIIFLPATADNPPTKNALSAKPFLTESQIKEVEASGFSYEEAARKKPDLIGFHELGHQYVDVYGIRATNQWLREFLASYFAYAFLSEKYPKLAHLYLALDEANLATIKPIHTSLEDLNNLGIGVGARNYGWYMGQLMRMVARVYEKKGLKFVAEVRKAFPMSEKESVSMNDGLQRLEKIYPGFIEWSKNLK